MNDSSPADAGPVAVMLDESAQRWMRFQTPRRIVTATRAGDVMPAIRDVERAVEKEGLHGAGWIAYEAAPGFDPALPARPSGDFPLVWFGLFEEAEPIELPPAAETLPAGWVADTSPEEYRRAFKRIKHHIREGDTYQVNYTYRLRHNAFNGDAWQAFLALTSAQPASCGAYIAAGRWRICSASPELFFRREGSHVESRPMKGTLMRGRSSAEDIEQARRLSASDKDRAENLMIVDMVRHDLGRIARPGSVRAEPLCALEKYPTVWQLTSTVTAESDATTADVLAAAFPPASITGAPKRRAMEIIASLERAPRQLYTGATGFLRPGQRAQFNVAIRTLWVDTARGRAEYGVGGGIVWDSDLETEQAECRAKTRILAARPVPEFALLETMRWAPGSGIYLLERHLDRLRESAEYFDRSCDLERVQARLAETVATLPPAPHRLRLLLARDGGVRIEAGPLASPPDAPRRVALARHPVDRSDPFLYHKTTHRRVYEEAKAEFPDHDDVLLYNENGEITESTIANIAVEWDGEWVTPPVECGLLPGTARADLLALGRLRERIIPVDLIRRGVRLMLLNSVRGSIPAVLDNETCGIVGD